MRYIDALQVVINGRCEIQCYDTAQKSWVYLTATAYKQARESGIVERPWA